MKGEETTIEVFVEDQKGTQEELQETDSLADDIEEFIRKETFTELCLEVYIHNIFSSESQH